MHTHKCYFFEFIFSNERFVYFVNIFQVSTSGKISPLLVEGRRSPATGDQEPPGRHRSGGAAPLTAASSPLATGSEPPDSMTASTGSSAGKLAKASGKSSSSLAKEPSPGEVSSSGKSRGGLSCLRPSTLDDDPEPLMKSPEKKQVMSPSGRSISDIFGKVRSQFFPHCVRASHLHKSILLGWMLTLESPGTIKSFQSIFVDQHLQCFKSFLNPGVCSIVSYLFRKLPEKLC